MVYVSRLWCKPKLEKKAFLWYNFSMTSKYKIGMHPQYEYQIKRNQHFCQVFTNTHINRWNKIYGFQPFRNCVLNHLFFKCGGSWVKEYWLKSCMGDWIGKSYTGDWIGEIGELNRGEDQSQKVEFLAVPLIPQFHIFCHKLIGPMKDYVQIEMRSD